MRISSTHVSLLSVVSTASALWISNLCCAQESAFRDAAPRASAPVGAATGPREPLPRELPHQIQQMQRVQRNDNSPWYYSGGSSPFALGRTTTKASAGIRAAAEAVRDAKGDDAKAAAQKKLTELLSKVYDDDMVQREKELTQIEERLAKLRELLSRRRTKKQEIIELQSKVALNEAEGLGFYDDDRPAKSGASVFYYGGQLPTAAPLAPPAPPAIAPNPTPTPAPDSDRIPH